MGVTILFLFTVISSGTGRNMDWRALSEFSSPAACQNAIATLGLPTTHARCVPK